MKGLDDVSKATLRERRRFAWRRLRGRMLAWRYLLIGLVLAVAGGLALWVLQFHGFGGLADVKKVDIVGGNTTVTPAMIEKAAKLPTGDPLLSANLDQIRTRVMDDPSLQHAVATADVSREWPDTVKIVVTMRTPVAVVLIAASASSPAHCEVLDKDGSLFGFYPLDNGACPRAVAALPIIQQPPGDPANPNASSAAYAQAAGVAADLPVSLRSLVKYIAAPSQDGVQLILKGDAARRINDGTMVIWGSAEDTLRKAQELSSLLKASPAVRGYNVSVISSPTVIP